MGDLLTYMLQVALCHAVLVLFYFLALRKLTFYSFNRVYLLSSALLALVLPLIQMGWSDATQVSGEVVEMIATRMSAVTEPVVAYSPADSVDYLMIFGGVYGVVMLFFLGRYFINYFKIKQLSDQYPLINHTKGVAVFRTPHTQPFSFFKSVFVPDSLDDRQSLDLVMAHELEHVQLAHSFDRMLVDFILVLFWFNPFIYFLRKLLIELHEYQVDGRISSDSAVKISYQQLLLQLAGGRLSGPVSFFNFSTIKQRIEMMNRNKSNSASLLRIVLLLPLLGGMITLFSFELVTVERPSLPEYVSIDNSTPVLEIPLMSNGIPSILPLKLDKDDIEVTSHFGMRHDPISKEKKYHTGIDFRADVGTPIIATADGKVVVSDAFKNWGKRIDIEHSEGYMTRFAHLSELHVKAGEKVKKGQVIGATGNSGLSSGPHLHYSVHQNEKPVNPVDYIKDFAFETKRPIKSSEPTEKANQIDDELLEVAQVQEEITEELDGEERLAYEQSMESEMKLQQEEMERAEEAELEALRSLEQAESLQAEMLEKQNEAEIESKRAQLEQLLEEKEKNKEKFKDKDKKKAK